MSKSPDMEKLIKEALAVHKWPKAKLNKVKKTTLPDVDMHKEKKEQSMVNDDFDFRNKWDGYSPDGEKI